MTDLMTGMTYLYSFYVLVVDLRVMSAIKAAAEQQVEDSDITASVSV